MNVISLGGGVQSTTLYLMSAFGRFPRADHAIFADTQWEPRAVYNHITYLCSLKLSIPIHVVSKGNIRKDALNPHKRFASMPLTIDKGDGTRPGRLRRQCTQEYKIRPIEKKVRELAGCLPRKRMKTHVFMWLGITTDEASRMKDNRTSWITNVYPLIDRNMTRQDCVNWLTFNNFPVPFKSSCIGCPYHDNAYWQTLKRVSPGEFEDAVNFDESIRMLRSRGEAYLHSSARPLADVFYEKAPLDEDCDGFCFL